MKKRTYYSDEECAMIVGGYRLTDGYERDYAKKMGVGPNAISYMKTRAIKGNFRQKFPEHFGDIVASNATLNVVDHRSDEVARLNEKVAELELLNKTMREQVHTVTQTNIRLANQLERAKRRLGKAVSLLLDDELKGE